MHSDDTKTKIRQVAILTVITIVLVVVVYWANKEDIVTLLGVVFSMLLGIVFEELCYAVVDLMEATNWKGTQRKLIRGGVIDGNTPVRISFAYLFRIKVDDKYLLILNGRNTGKYQPVGGVYKMHSKERMELKNRFHVVDDNKLHIDELSRNDYRLYVPNKYLRGFVRRFDRGAVRETVQNLEREFREELVSTGILDWDSITYRYCGRHMTDLQYEKHFQTYELLLADIVELCPSQSQLDDLSRIAERCPEALRFATADEINRLGVKTEERDLADSIASHAFKILQEEETELLSPPGTGDVYTAKLRQ